MKRKMSKKLLTLLVIFCLLFSAIPYPSFVAAEVVIDTETVSPAIDDSLAQLRASLSPVEPNLNKYVMSKGDLSIAELKTVTLNEKDIPEILNNEEFDKTFHVNRLYDQEEDLNTIIFQNIDGTKSMYTYPFEIKYENEAGMTVDKTVSMIQSELATLQEESLTTTVEAAEINASPLPTPTIEHPGAGDFAGDEELEDGIHDVAVLEDMPYYCTGLAYRTYVGQHASFGQTKTYVRFPYLAANPVYERITYSQIIDVKYNVYKVASDAAANVCVCMYTGTFWDEATANYTTPSNIWTSYVFMTGMQYEEVPVAEGWYSFDIKPAVGAWKGGGHNISQGLVIIGSSTQTDKMYGQEFYSVEGGLHEGVKIPSVTITWRPEEQTTIQDGKLYAIKNKNGNYLTIGTNSEGTLDSVITAPKKNVYSYNDGVQGTLEENLFDPSQLWMVTSIDGNVYRLYSVYVIDGNKTDGYVLCSDDSYDVLVAQSTLPGAKWILEKYNNKIYLFNAHQDRDEYMLAAYKDSEDVYLSTDDRYAYWTFEEVDVTDTYADITINPSDGTFFNFIVHDSAIYSYYTFDTYKAIEDWNGISPNLTARVYRADDDIVIPADYTVHIKGYTTEELIEMYPSKDDNFGSYFAITQIDSNNYEQNLPFEIQMNRSKLPYSSADAEITAMHEAGHAFLLEHPDELHHNYRVASIMNGGSYKSMRTSVPSIYDQYNIKRRWD